MEYKNFSYEEHIDSKFHITAHKKNFMGNTGVHFHQFFEIEIILSGEGSCMINGTQYALSSGSMYILTPADFHFLCGDTKLELYNIMFDETMIDKELISQLFEKQDKKFLVLKNDILHEIKVLVEMIVRERNTVDEYSENIIKNLLSAVINIILREMDFEQKGEETDNKISDALRYIYANLRSDPTLSQVAKYCGYSVNYFGKMFYEATGKQYKAFINEMKLNMAKRMLRLDNVTVQEVASECGFSSISNFYRVFKQIVGVSPNIYRKRENYHEK